MTEWGIPEKGVGHRDTEAQRTKNANGDAPGYCARFLAHPRMTSELLAEVGAGLDADLGLKPTYYIMRHIPDYQRR